MRLGAMSPAVHAAARLRPARPLALATRRCVPPGGVVPIKKPAVPACVVLRVSATPCVQT